MKAGSSSKSDGSVMDILGAGITVLAMTIIMAAYIGNLQVLSRKAEISQLTRKYILKMETVGCLTESDRVQLISELTGLGVTDCDLSGTTMNHVGYGSSIILSISGRLSGTGYMIGSGLLTGRWEERPYDFKDVKMSTAKN